MGRRKSSGGNGFLIIVIFVGVIIAINHWQFFLVVGGIALVGYMLFKQDPSPKETTNSEYQYSVSITVGNDGSDEKNDFCISESLDIQQRMISCYLLYTSDSKSNLPHVVSRKLKVDFQSDSADKTSYYPSYSELNPRQRGAFLKWLETGRSSPTVDLGYVFIYFYGLEHRAVREKLNHLEIFNELLRLHKIYSSTSRSFKGYAERLIGWLIAANPSWNLDELITDKSLISELGDHDIPQSYFSQRLNSQADFARLSFDSLFGECYISKANPGIVKDEAFILYKEKLAKLTREPSVSEVDQTIDYTSSSSFWFEESLTVRINRIGNESKFSSMIQDVFNELSEYAQAKSIGEFHTSFLLPAQLQSYFPDPKVTSLKNEFLISKKVIDLDDLANRVGVQIKDTYGVVQSRKLSRVMTNLDLMIEPEFEVTGKSYKSGEKVVVTVKQKFPCKGVSQQRYLKASALFDLGMSIAVSDSKLDEKEAGHVIQHLTQSLKLNEEESFRLMLRKSLIEEGSIKVTGLTKKMIDSLQTKDLKVIGKFLFAIAAMDGQLDKNEVKLLEKNFKKFGLDDGFLGELIKEASTQPNGPVLLKAGKESKKGSAIPQLKDDNAIILDDAALRAAFANTEEVSRILSDVFVEQDIPEMPELSQTVEPSAVSAPEMTLKEAHKALLDFLLTKSIWDCSEVEDFCRSLGVMYGSSINVLNEWAEAQYGEPILEDDGSEVTVNKELVEQGVKSA